MHDFDRTMSELPGWTSEGESALGSYGQPSFDGESEGDFEGDDDHEGPPFSEAEEMELAAEVLAATDERELDRFLGDLFKKVGRSAGRLLKSKVGRSLGGALRGIAKTALPLAGSAIGTALLPGVGTALGGVLGGAASNLFEVDESLGADEMDFETARGFVRLAGAAARNAIRDDVDGRPPDRVAQAALMRAARRHAPGLVRRRHPMSARRPGMVGPLMLHAYGRSNGAINGALDVGGIGESIGVDAGAPAESLSPEEELEAASDLLAITSEHELDDFLGGVLRKAVQKGGAFVKKGVGQQLTGALKQVARRTVPGVSRALDLAQGFAPSLASSPVTNSLAQRAGHIFGLEMEGMSPEDQELEAARRVVRLASSAGARAAQASRTTASPTQIARSSLVDAAREHAPGLLAGQPGGAGARPESAASGRWIRKGSHIVLIGAGA